MRKYVKYLGSHTTSIIMKGLTNMVSEADSKKSLITKAMFGSISLNCSNLIHLELRNCIMDPFILKFSMDMSLKNLESLVLNKVCLPPRIWSSLTESLFYGIKGQGVMPKLRKLELIKPIQLSESDRLVLNASCETTATLNDDHQIYTFTI